MKRLITLFVTLLALGASQATQPASLPPSEANAKAALEKSPRHGEWADVKVGDRTIRCWVTYPEVKDKAGVVIVVHEIFGLTDWVKSVGDQLAADGFIAIAPDLLSGKGPNGGNTDAFPDRGAVTAAVRGLPNDEVNAALDAVREYGVKLPAANGKSATVGYCWGGAVSFTYAAHQPDLNAAVVYYGTNPADEATIAKIKAPLLGLYGGDDARVNTTVGPAKDAMAKANKPYTTHTYEGAGHGFLRQQEGRNGANLKAATEAWKQTVEFLKQHLK